jgi:DNA-binding NarL/FixJ family response regulator
LIASEIVGGLSLKVIADQLCLSIQAVSTYLSRAQRKLGLTSRHALAEVVSGNTLLLDNIPALPHLTRLTNAERAVGAGMLAGCPNSAIAQMRGTSVRTVENQASSLMRKLGLGSRAELIAAATRLPPGSESRATNGVDEHPV